MEINESRLSLYLVRKLKLINLMMISFIEKNSIICQVLRGLILLLHQISLFT